MKQGIFTLVKKSLLFYRRSSVYQALIVIILAAIITGSLLTGSSVRDSLKESANQHLGKCNTVISSGLRYFESSLAAKIEEKSGSKCAAILETSGYCQNFETGNSALNTKIFGIQSDFFSFNGIDSIRISSGNVAINQKLAEFLSIKPGDDIIIHFREVSSIPVNAPFATNTETGITKVLKVEHILKPEQSGNFSLGISQIVPMNVFINMTDLTDNSSLINKANRLLILEKKDGESKDLLNDILKKSLSYSDIGLNLREVKATGGFELVSERIFIDQEVIDEVRSVLPSAQPLITYLANSISKNGKSTPYSFVSGLPELINSGLSSVKNIYINKWLSDDLNASFNDTLQMSWYAPMENGKLKEISNRFVVSKLVRMDSIWNDPSLMPEFPGIAGTSSCSEWDAGVPVNMKLIRKKDEGYWNEYKGTPKAFIAYSDGKELWGSNFGPATAIRFPSKLKKAEIENLLNGIFIPGKTGFSINNVKADSIKAADESVDFSTLFLSLGIFIIISCIILLSLSVSLFFDSKKNQVYTYFALGFTDKWIKRLLLYETLVISFTGALFGVFAGWLINVLIIRALNSVWSGAVQTNTLSPHFSLSALATGFLTTVVICFVLLRIKVKNFLHTLKKTDSGIYEGHSVKKNNAFILISVVSFVLLFSASLLFRKYAVSISFTTGVILFISLILLARMYAIKGIGKKKTGFLKLKNLSGLYYSFHPSQAITPVLFIASGIFALFITGVNRLDISDKMKEASGGTGGYLLWCESSVPLKANLNSLAGKREFGLNEEGLQELSFVQMKKTPGDDASCLNLNHVSVPPLLGLDPSNFIANGSFSFKSQDISLNGENPWIAIQKTPVNNTIYGIVDQTVLQWGLKMSLGDTISLRSESGQKINVILIAGLKSSVFQGFILIGDKNFDRFYPSVQGSTLFLATGNPMLTDRYKEILKQRLSNYGVSIMPSIDRLSSFFEVTNTYLSVFIVLGILGMVLGVTGLGFILLQNYNFRKKEFSLMLATGYQIDSIRRLVIREQIQILSAGILIGIASAAIATLPSLTSGSSVPWRLMTIMVISVFLSG
jgi:putative ABC transport system permease protein